MSKSDSKADDVQNTDQKETTKVRRLLLLTGLWILVATSFGFMGFGFFAIGIVSFYGTVKLTCKCHQRYQVSLLPHAITDRISQSEFVQIFFVRARTQVGTHILWWLAVFGLIFTVIGGQTLLLEPVLEVEQMTVNRGVVEDIKRQPRTKRARHCGDRFDIRTERGEKIRYYGRLNEQIFNKLKEIKGQEITVWSQTAYGLPPCVIYNNCWQIKAGNQMVKAYEKQYPEQFHRWGPKIVTTIGLISFLCLMRIWFVHRRKRC